MTLNDIIAALGVVINGIPQALLALSVGFEAFPTSLGFLVGVIACLFLQSPIPISMQAETIALAGSMGRDKRERLSIIFWTGIIMAILGLTGLLSFIVGIAGDEIINAMMAGVGLILAKIAIDGIKINPQISGISTGVAIVIYFLSGRNLVYTIVVSVLVSSIYANIKKMDIGNKIVAEERKFRLRKPTMSTHILRGALALSCLTIGANIAFGNITASLGNGAANVDHLTIYSGIADSVSALFGGAPVESIISATGASDNPVNSGVLMMVILGLIMFLGLLPKLGKYVPGESIHGFLFVLGALVTVPTNAAVAFSGVSPDAAILSAITMTVTASTDPFFGLMAGIILKFILF
ncbi:NCS2 family permease [Anaerococcus sp. AGMB09787]|uniref:NCS2 family permease n=1 Tax=Anaerococcus sp. AGMB09787 TaxID=2922869 RepID=UPI001FB00382|nr:NCS2 family permease [Anaerococcus sp. AGMB09787]